MLETFKGLYHIETWEFQVGLRMLMMKDISLNLILDIMALKDSQSLKDLDFSHHSVLAGICLTKIL